jgi:AcrR family transcriptional regulator
VNDAGVNKRRLLLERALERFARHGYDATGVQEICQDAGVTKPTLYHYFGSKRGLLEALVRERCAPLMDNLISATAYQGDLPLSLTRTVEVHFAFATKEPLLYRLLLTLWFAMPDNEAFEVAADHMREIHRRVEELFMAAVVDHGNMRDRHHAYAATLLGMINTYVAMALNGYAELTTPVVHQVVHQFSYGIYS